ncbi:MAG: Bug family tripartite tricarboxylate transporter substrate binding protein [Advenella sp.]|uniref:Bug family tripartite tricarboxylate transporter substrate binding protein n=1 Tax=unclassified Advenella TaxID=2685285 RepID=UPI001867C336|nr:tripartite tricarboxylate transporter substrate binding protein [Advenella sp. FME57]
MNQRIANIIVAATATFGLAAAAPACAAYPEKPIRLVVPYTPAGAADQLARALAQNMGQALGQAVVVENKPGASTKIGATQVARSPADGYTLFLASNSSMVLNPLLYKNFPYDPERDYRIVSIVADIPLVVITNEKSGLDSMHKFVDYAKRHPGKLNYASVGNGNPLHLATELLLGQYGIKATHVPYNGSAPALTSLMSNDTQLMIDVVSTSLPLIKDGKIKALAVTSPRRLDVLPNVPSVSEIGKTNYQASTWFGIAVPKSTPDAVVNALRTAIDTTLKNESFQKRFETLGLYIQQPREQQQVDQFVDEDRAKWKTVIENNRITLD